MPGFLRPPHNWEAPDACCRRLNSYQNVGSIFLIWLQYHILQLDLNRRLLTVTRPLHYIHLKSTLYQPLKPFEGTPISAIVIINYEVFIY